jgi:hypothetical protein
VPPALNRRLITMRDNGGPIMVNGVVGSSIRVVASNALSDTAILLDSTQVAASTGDITVDQSGICASPHVMADNAAILALLRRDGFVQLASEIRRGKPISPKVRRQVAALCLGVGTHDQLGEWEVLEADGSISNNLDPQPSAPRRTRATVFDDE